MKIDNSQLQTYKDCPKKYYNKYNLCIRHVMHDTMALDFGKTFHMAKELMRTVGIDKALEYVKTTQLGDDQLYSQANMLTVVQQYYNLYQSYVNELSDINLTSLKIEVTDIIKIDDIDYIVKLDEIVKGKNGLVMPMETKTTKSNLYFYPKYYDISGQISGYCYYIQKKYGQCSGSILDVVKVGYRKNKYLGEPAGFHWKPLRIFISRTPQQLEDWETNLVQWSYKFKWSERTGVYPRNEGACNMYSGCEYKDLCVSCDDIEIMKSLYEKCDPFEYLNLPKEVK